MGKTCPFCGGCNIDEDAARGDATCMDCGTVLEESIVVAENQFQERAGGSGHTLVGQFISNERQAYSMNGIPGYSTQESREITYQKGRKLIEEIGSQLRITSFCIETSYNFYKMCVVKQLTKGRPRSHVAAACMYMSCRLDNTSHLLLDFSDVTQVNVFDLGRCLSFLSRALHIVLPSTDPCLYVMRFACGLEFGENQKSIVNLATRLVERMKRDWIAIGRRPSGLCGAALLIAARAYNFNRSISDIVRVVNISETVVRRRLEEFSQTPSGALSIDDFQTVDLEQSEDPPAFLAAKRKAREQEIIAEQRMAETMQQEVQNLEVEVEKALEKRRRDSFKRTSYAKELTKVDQIEIEKNAVPFVNQHILESVYDAADSRWKDDRSITEFSQFGPTLESLGLKKDENYENYISLPTQDNENGDLNFNDIDDNEIDSYILSNAESKIKEKFWMKANGEHLKLMEQKKKEKEEAESAEPSAKKKRQKKDFKNNDPDCIPTTAAKALKMTKIQEKVISEKVNYSILNEISNISYKKEEQSAEPVKAENVGNKKEEIDLSERTNDVEVLTVKPKIARRFAKIPPNIKRINKEPNI